jgi:hypothetical protein
MSHPYLDTAGWSIIDYELAYAGLQHINDATKLLQNQPRAINGDTGDYHLGANFIVELGEGWCSGGIDFLMERLRTIRFNDPKDDERRVLLLITYASSYGCASDPVAAIIQMALDQSVRPAA